MGWRSNQSILKEINPEYSLKKTDAEAEAPILWPPDLWRANSLENTLMQGKIWGQEEKGKTEDEMVDGINDSMDMSLSKLQFPRQGSLACCSPQGVRVRHNSATEQQMDS